MRARYIWVSGGVLLLGILVASGGEAILSSAYLGAGNFDATVGLDVNKTYLNAVNLKGGALTINGVSFAASAGGNPSGGNWSIGGVSSTWGSTAWGSVSGELGSTTSGKLMSDFIYGGNPGTLTLSGLTAGKTYILTFYNASWDAAGGRLQTFSTTSGASVLFDEDIGASSAGYANLLRYTFRASGSTEVITITPRSAATMHLYGFSTEEVFNKIWSSGADWTTATWAPAGVPNAAGANVTFSAQGSPTVINLDADQTVGHIQFDGANAWTLSTSSGRTLTLQSDTGGVSVCSALSGTHTISAGVTLSNDMLKVGSGTLALSGAVTDNGRNVTIGAGTLAIVNAGAQGLGAVLAGTGAFAKSGGGALTLSASNTHSGGTTLSAGQLNINNASALGSGPFVIGGGTTIDNTSGASLAVASNNVQTWSGDFTFVGTTNLNFGTGSVDLGTGIRTVTVSAGTLTVGGSITNSGSLVKAGPGTLMLSGSNAYAGATTISGGTLKSDVAIVLTNRTFTSDSNSGIGTNSPYGPGGYTHAFAFNQGADLNINGVTFVNTGTNRSGTGWLTSNYPNNGPGGTFPTGFQPASGQQTYSLFNHFLYGGGNNTQTLTISNLMPGFSYNARIYFRSYGNPPGSRIVNWTFDPGLGSPTTMSGFNEDINSTGNYLDFTYVAGQAGTLTMSAADTGANSWHLYGFSNQRIGTYLPTNTAVNITASGAVLDLGATAQSIGSLAGVYGASVINNGALTAGGDNSSSCFAGVISGSGSFTKVGTGTMTLSGTNTYSGGTTLSNGVLSVSAYTNLPSAGGLNFCGGTLQITGTEISNLSSYAFTGTNFNGCIDVNGGNTLVVPAAISGSGSFIKSGAGTLTLSGGGTYRNGMTINAGTLQFGNGGLVSGNIVNLSTLVFNSSNCCSVAGVISGTGALSQAGSGNLVLSGTNTYSGTTTITGGSLLISGTDTTGGFAIGNAGFESPVFGAGSWSYNPAGGTWIFDAASGIARNGSPWINTAPEGSQAGFLQNASVFSQIVTVAVSGLYDIRFRGAGRPGGAFGPDNVALRVDGTQVAYWPSTSFGVAGSSGAFYTNTVIGLYLLAGSHTLAFAGTTPGGDRATAIDLLTVNGYAVGNLPTNGVVNIAASGVSLVLAGGSQPVGSLSGVTGSIITNNGILTVGGDNVNTTFAGLMSGSGSLIKVGTGTLTISGWNTCAGATTISGGTLRAVCPAVALNTQTFTNDAGSGIGTNSPYGLAGYTHSFAFNQGADLNINGVTFVNTGTSRSGTGWSTSNYPNNGPGGSFPTGFQPVSGQQTYSLFNHFIYGAGNNTQTLTISNLTPGVAYNARIYYRSWGNPPGSRVVNWTFNPGTGSVTTTNGVNEDINAAGNCLSFTYVAGPAGTLVMSAADTSVSSWHLYGFSNQRIGNSLPTNTAVSVAAPGAVLDIDTAVQTIGSLAGVEGSSVSNNGALTAGGDNTSTLFAGVISGSGSFTKLGSGTLTLTGPNNYAGATVIGKGVLQVGNGGVTGTLGAGAVSNDASLVFNRTDSAYTNMSSISGSGMVIKTGSGTVTLTGTNTYSGATVVNAGTLDLYTNAVISSSRSVTVSAGARLTIQNTNNVLSDSADLRLFTSGIVYLTNGVRDTVDSLMIDGLPAATGTWGTVNCRWTNTSVFAGAGVLVVANDAYWPTWSLSQSNVVLNVVGGKTNITYSILGFNSNITAAAALLCQASNTRAFTFTDTNALASVDRRFYRVAENLAGMETTNEWIYTAFRKQLDPGTWNKYALGIDFGASNRLDSTLGIQITQGLAGNADKNSADLFYLLDSHGGWAMCYLNGSGSWCDYTSGIATNTEVLPWQSFWIKRRGGSVTYPMYSGFCFTNATPVAFRSNDWHMITWQLPWDRKESDGSQQGWGLAASGGQKGTSWLNSDVLTAGDGNAFRFYYLHTSGRWCAAGQTTPASNLYFRVGDAYYYMHRGTGFTWTATAPFSL